MSCVCCYEMAWMQYIGLSTRSLKAKGTPKGASKQVHTDTYTLNEDPQPQVLFTAAFSNLKPAASRVST